MSTNNAFIKLQETANGRVSVKLQKNRFAKEGTENYFGRVERYTYSTQNILDVVAEENPLVDLGTAASILTAYANAVLKALAAGHAVKFGELGIFYIAGKGTVEKDGEKPKLTVRFSATQTLKDAVQNVEITDSEYVLPTGTITDVTDVTTGKTDGMLTATGSVLVEGSNLKVGGADSGIWFAPVSDSSAMNTEESEWKKIETTLIFNQPSKLLFTLPQELAAGRYKIVVRTRFGGKAGYERKYFIESVSDIVTLS